MSKKYSTSPARKHYDAPMRRGDQSGNHEAWKQRVVQEDNSHYKSLQLGLDLGIVSEVPIPDQVYKTIAYDKRDVLDILVDQKQANQKESQFPPRMIYGNSIMKNVLSGEREGRNISPQPLYPNDINGGRHIEKVYRQLDPMRSSIRTYNTDAKPSYMRASIDLSQPDIRRVSPSPQPNEQISIQREYKNQPAVFNARNLSPYRFGDATSKRNTNLSPGNTLTIGDNEESVALRIGKVNAQPDSTKNSMRMSSQPNLKESREFETSKGFGGVGKSIIAKNNSVMDNMRSVNEAKKQYFVKPKYPENGGDSYGLAQEDYNTVNNYA